MTTPYLIVCVLFVLLAFHVGRQFGKAEENRNETN